LEGRQEVLLAVLEVPEGRREVLGDPGVHPGVQVVLGVPPEARPGVLVGLVGLLVVLAVLVVRGVHLALLVVVLVVRGVHLALLVVQVGQVVQVVLRQGGQLARK